MREGFISTEVFVWSQMALAFGFPLWFGWSQLRALRRMREREARLDGASPGRAASAADGVAEPRGTHGPG